MPDSTAWKIVHAVCITGGIACLALSIITFIRAGANTFNFNSSFEDQAHAMSLNASYTPLPWGSFAVGGMQAFANLALIQAFSRCEKAGNVSAAQRAHKKKMVLTIALAFNIVVAIADVSLAAALGTCPLAGSFTLAVVGTIIAFLGALAAVVTEIVFLCAVGRESHQTKVETFGRATEYDVHAAV